MDSSLVITIVILAAIAWVAYLGVSALRSRGSEEVPSNLAPGTTDDVMETRRLESVQLGAVVLSGFLAVAIPIYYLTENNRQEGFVEEFHETAVERGHEWYEEFGCGTCHGVDGGGGAAPYTEKRTGVAVTWAAPSINDVFYRYDREEVKYWLVYGRGNSPMPAWGTEGGGPMNDAQIEELLDYLESDEFRIAQPTAAQEVEAGIDAELSRLENAQATVEEALLTQQQVIADLYRTDDLADPMTAIAEQMRDALDAADEGIDTDGDGVSDTAEERIAALNQEARAALLPEPLTLDFGFAPDDSQTNGVNDLEAARSYLEALETLASAPLEQGATAAPVLGPFAESVSEILAGFEPAEAAEAEGDTTETDDAATTTTTTTTEGGSDSGADEPADDVDTDGDGLTDGQEAALDAIAQQVVNELVGINPVSFDPTNPESTVGATDLETAREAVSAVESMALNFRVTVENFERIEPPALAALENLDTAIEERRWEFDFEGIAANIGGSVEDAERVVGLYNYNCARCHTSGYSAGLAFTQEAGSGGLGPALWDGRPAVQFLSDEDLVDFLIVGAEPNEPYGVNGFGNGKMPAFGQLIAQDDLELLARWLRAGDLTGVGDQAFDPLDEEDGS